MREIPTDIRERLQRGEYQNEEHVRLSLVCRLLFKLGWNIWSLREVNTEFPAIPTEDKTKVDIALFAKESFPSVFIEVKAVGKIRKPYRCREASPGLQQEQYGFVLSHNRWKKLAPLLLPDWRGVS